MRLASGYIRSGMAVQESRIPCFPTSREWSACMDPQGTSIRIRCGAAPPIPEVQQRLRATQNGEHCGRRQGEPAQPRLAWMERADRHGVRDTVLRRTGGPNTRIPGMTAENPAAQCTLRTCPVDRLDEAGPPGRIKRPASRNPAATVPGRETTGSRVHRPPCARSRPRQSSHHCPCRAQGPGTPRRIRRPGRPLPGPI